MSPRNTSKNYCKHLITERSFTCESLFMDLNSPERIKTTKKTIRLIEIIIKMCNTYLFYIAWGQFTLLNELCNCFCLFCSKILLLIPILILKCIH